MIAEVLLILLSFVFVSLGVAGVFLPVLPGVPLAWIGMLIFAATTDFSAITLKVLLIFFGLSVLTLITDIAAPLIGAKKYNSSPYGMYGAVIGLLFGMAVFGPLGIILGPFLGAIFGEMYFGKEPEEAMRSAKGVFIGFLAGSAIKLSLI